MKREKYFHVCGRAGIGFAAWLYERLRTEGTCILVDCSRDEILTGYVKRSRIECEIIQSDRLLMDVYSSEYVVFFHEREDAFIDRYPGVHFFFAEISDIGYVDSILTKLTNGKLCLFKRTLIQQIGGRGKLYILSLCKKKVTGEYFIYRFLLMEDVRKEMIFSEILGSSQG